MNQGVGRIVRWWLIGLGWCLLAEASDVNHDPIQPGQYTGANVIFVEFPDVRRDRLGSHGYSRPITPHLDAAARRGVRFEHVVTAAPWCIPAKLAIWTGLYPSTHGVVNKYAVDQTGQLQRARLSDTIPTFPELLKRQAGYTLVGFTGGAGVAGISGLGRGFDRYVDDVDFDGFHRTVPLAIAWLRKERQEPFFMFLQGYSAHGQAIPPPGGYTRVFAPHYRGKLTASPEEWKRLREDGLLQRFHTDQPVIDRLGLSAEDQAFYLAIYDEKIQRLDRWIGRFLDALNYLQLQERTIVVLFSGHGDEWFDHGFIDHGTHLYEEAIDVPLILLLPGMTQGRLVESQVRTIDLFPTVFDLLGLSSLPVTGGSVLPALNGQAMNLVGFSETQYRLFTHKSVLVTPDHRYKLIYTHDRDQWELYDLLQDPHETQNLASERPEVAEPLKTQFRRLLKDLKDAAPHAS